jgi:hypothetical protein
VEFQYAKAAFMFALELGVTTTPFTFVAPAATAPVLDTETLIPPTTVVDDNQ